MPRRTWTGDNKGVQSGFVPTSEVWPIYSPDLSREPTHTLKMSIGGQWWPMRRIASFWIPDFQRTQRLDRWFAGCPEFFG